MHVALSGGVVQWRDKAGPRFPMPSLVFFIFVRGDKESAVINNRCRFIVKRGPFVRLLLVKRVRGARWWPCSFILRSDTRRRVIIALRARAAGRFFVNRPFVRV